MGTHACTHTCTQVILRLEAEWSAWCAECAAHDDSRTRLHGLDLAATSPAVHWADASLPRTPLPHHGSHYSSDTLEVHSLGSPLSRSSMELSFGDANYDGSGMAQQGQSWPPEIRFVDPRGPVAATRYMFCGHKAPPPLHMFPSLTRSSTREPARNSLGKRRTAMSMQLIK